MAAWPATLETLALDRRLIACCRYPSLGVQTRLLFYFPVGHPGSLTASSVEYWHLPGWTLEPSIWCRHY